MDKMDAQSPNAQDLDEKWPSGTILNILPPNIEAPTSTFPDALQDKNLFYARGAEEWNSGSNHEDYYQTHEDNAVLEARVEMIVKLLPSPIHIVELGPGDGTKAKIFLAALHRQGKDWTWTGLDASYALLKSVIQSLQVVYPQNKIRGMHMDFTKTLELVPMSIDGPRYYVSLGSTLANGPDPSSRIQAAASIMDINDYLHISADCHGIDSKDKIQRSYEPLLPFIRKTLKGFEDYKEKDWELQSVLDDGKGGELQSSLDEKPPVKHLFRITARHELVAHVTLRKGILLTSSHRTNTLHPRIVRPLRVAGCKNACLLRL